MNEKGFEIKDMNEEVGYKIMELPLANICIDFGYLMYEASLRRRYEFTVNRPTCLSCWDEYHFDFVTYKTCTVEENDNPYDKKKKKNDKPPETYIISIKTHYKCYCDDAQKDETANLYPNIRLLFGSFFECFSCNKKIKLEDAWQVNVRNGIGVCLTCANKEDRFRLDQSMVEFAARLKPSRETEVTTRLKTLERKIDREFNPDSYPKDMREELKERLRKSAQAMKLNKQ